MKVISSDEFNFLKLIYDKLLSLNNKIKLQLMPRSEHSQSFSVSSQRSGINTVEKMQKQADNYTKKYEWQRRNLLTLQTVQSNLKLQVQQLKKNVTKLKKQSQDGQIKLMFTKMRNLQKQIDINDKRYNQTMGDIDKLKKEINALRQDKSMYKHNLKSLETDIERADLEITNLMGNIQSSQSMSKTSQNLMLGLKMKNQQDKTNYYKRLNQLNKQLKDPRLNRASRIKTGDISAIQNDTSSVLKNRLTKLILNNKQKVKLIDNYQRNMKVIDEAFNTIKQATGLTDIKQIQNTFIKGEEQNYNLLTYVDVLNQEIDALVDNNQSLRLKNEALAKENQEKQRILSGTSDDEKRKIQIQEYISSRKKEVEEFQGMLNDVQPLLKQVLIKLAHSKFNKNPHKIQEYESSGVTLNDSNLDEYLAELQLYTNDILIYRGKANNLSSSQIYAKTLLLDQLSPKQFKKKASDNTSLLNVLDQVKEKAKGIQKLLDRQQLQQMAKKDLQAKKVAEITKPKKK